MSAQGTNFESEYTLRSGQKSLDLRKPVVMGIVNVTPDSFYSGSRLQTEREIIETAAKHLQDGASILDLGAVSTKPHAAYVSPEDEWNRLLPALKRIRSIFPDTFLSIDTCRSKIAEAASDSGADMINDISGGMMDPDMFKQVGKQKLPYILMHMQGTPQTMQQNPTYKDVTEEVMTFLDIQVVKAREAGITQIVLDPGFGFGKTSTHNFKLLSDLNRFSSFGLPLLVGVSRKSMVYKALEIMPEEALNGTTILHTLALLNGANILRVHDVKEAKQAIRLVNCYHSV